MYSKPCIRPGFTPESLADRHLIPSTPPRRSAPAARRRRRRRRDDTARHHHTAPRHPPHRTAPHHTTPHHTTPHNTTPHRTAPHHTKSHHTTPLGKHSPGDYTITLQLFLTRGSMPVPNILCGFAHRPSTSSSSRLNMVKVSAIIASICNR